MLNLKKKKTHRSKNTLYYYTHLYLYSTKSRSNQYYIIYSLSIKHVVMYSTTPYSFAGFQEVQDTRRSSKLRGFCENDTWTRVLNDDFWRWDRFQLIRLTMEEGIYCTWRSIQSLSELYNEIDTWLNRNPFRKFLTVLL